MNTHRNLILAALVVSAAFPAHSRAATNQYWNPGGTGGDGIWGTSPGDKNWNTVAGAPTGNTFWPDSVDDVAVFQDALGGTVTVFDPVQAAGIVQNGADYTINASTITLDRGSPGPAPTVEVDSGTLTIDSVLAGAAGMDKTGAAKLVLSADNTYTGTTTVQQGTLKLSGSLPSTMVRIDAGASMLDQGDIGDASSVTNNGTLTVDLADTIGTYVQNPGARLDGAGALTTTGGATLRGGTVAGTLLGNITSTGDVVVSGTLGGGALTLTGGVLDLTGAALGPLVNVQAGQLKLSGDNLADTSLLNVQSGGTVTLNGDDTVGGASIAGTLNGPGTLTAPFYSLQGGAVIDGHLGEGTFDKADAGTVTINGTLASDAVTVPNGTLVLSGDNLEDTAAVSTFAPGVLRMDGDDTVATYTSHGGTLSGTGTLTTTAASVFTGPSGLAGSLTAEAGATFNDTSTVTGTLTGDSVFNDSSSVDASGIVHGNITSTGTVTISGTVGGGGLTVTGGVLDLTGTALSPIVDVQNGGLILSGDNIADSSRLDVQSGGTVTLNGDDTVERATIRGIVNGAGTLTASIYSLQDGAVINGHLGEGNFDMRGTVTINGTLASDRISVGGRTSLLILSGDNLEDTAAVETFREGTIRMDGDDTVGTYEGYGTLAGSGVLTAVNGAIFTYDSVVSGNLRGDIDVSMSGRRPELLVSGTIGGGSLDVKQGTLVLTGTSTNTPITIFPRALLDDQSGGLADNAAVILADQSAPRQSSGGTLNLDADDTVARFTSNSGTLSGPGTLTVTDGAELHGNSRISGNLSGNTISDGMVLVSGTVGGGSLDVTGGILTITGHAANTPVRISPGASIVTRSPDALSDTAALTNGGTLVLNGTEQIGSYRSLAGGALQLDVTGPSVLDRLAAQTVTLESGSALTLETTNLGLGEIADIIDGTIAGTFATITPLAGTGADFRYSFNPDLGTIQAIPGQSYPDSRYGKATLYNLTWNQTRVIGAAFDDTYVDPIPAPGQAPNGNFHKIHYRDTGDPDPALRWQEIPVDQARFGDTWVYDLDPGLGRAPAAPGSQEALLGEAITRFQASYDIKRDKSGAPVTDARGNPVPVVTGPGKAVANSLSPESYQGLADFTRQAVRGQIRAAMDSAPVAMLGNGRGQVFAAATSSSAGTDASPNNAAYDVNPNGALAGVRYQVNPCLQLGAMVGATDGDIKGALIDTDASGYVIGAFGKYLLGEGSRTSLFASLGYGDFDYDATRRSYGGPVAANGIGSSAVEFAFGIESALIEHGPFRVVPHALLRYMNGTVDGFTEVGRGVRMSVGSLDIDSMLLDVGVGLEYRPVEYATLTAQLGYLNDFKDSGNVVAGRYLAGGAPVGVYAPGIDEQAVVLGFGAWFDVNASFRIGFNWRSEFRNDSQNLNSIGVGGSWGF